ncbi:MAG: hypothetical protein BGN88_13990 [Clostridiales bacterium 43-6]|nr:MAG: hypothetical protein BGN88_13990 [Clostridiales bacterium 43-6]
MKKLKTVHKIALYFSASAVLFVVHLFLNVYHPKSYYNDIINVFSIVFAVLSGYNLYRYLLLERLERFIRSLIKRSSEFFGKLRARRISQRKKKKIILGGSRDEHSYIFFDKSQKSQQQKRKEKRKTRWKDMQTNSERIRFLYRRFVLHAVRQGVTVKETQTPLEIQEALREQAIESETMTDLYIRSRYGKESLTDCDVEQAATFLYKK